jgi:hypothetical protein
MLGLGRAAALLDDSIKHVSKQRQKTVQGRKNPQLFHALVREQLAIRTESDVDLASEGLIVHAGTADSIRLQMANVEVWPKLVHRPTRAFQAPEGLFDLGNAELFGIPGETFFLYTVKDGALGRLTLTQIISDRHEMFFSCEYLGEIVLYDTARGGLLMPEGQARPTKVDPNQDDGLDGIVRRKADLSPHEILTQHEEYHDQQHSGARSHLG